MPEPARAVPRGNEPASTSTHPGSLASAWTAERTVLCKVVAYWMRHSSHRNALACACRCTEGSGIPGVVHQAQPDMPLSEIALSRLMPGTPVHAVGAEGAR